MRKPPDDFEIISDEWAAVFRAMTGAQRLMFASEMREEVRRVMLLDTQAGHPEWSDAEVRREVSRRLLAAARDG